MHELKEGNKMMKGWNGQFEESELIHLFHNFRAIILYLNFGEIILHFKPDTLVDHTSKSPQF